MITVDSTVNLFANLKALQAAAIVTFGAQYNDCNQTRNGAAWTVYLSQSIVNQQTLWDNLIAAQDPVYIYSDKTLMLADNIERCTITVTAPKPGAAPVVLQVSVNGGILVDFPIPLTGGIGSDYFTAKDPGTITVTVKNGSNRSADVLTIKAA